MPAKYCPNCQTANRSTSKVCICGTRLEGLKQESPDTTGKATSGVETAYPAAAAGALLIASGVACALYFWFGFDPTIESDMLNRAYNVGLLQKQAIGIVGGLQLATVGTVLACHGRPKQS